MSAGGNSSGEAAAGFSLSGIGGSFSSKAADVFAQLDGLEKKHDDFLASAKDDDDVIKRDPIPEPLSSMKRDSAESDRDYGRSRNQGDCSKRDGGFKRPSAMPRPSRMPDHKMNPQKYKHYNLSDVSVGSDRSNSAAAFEFLNEQRKRREEQMEVEDGNVSDKIVFKKPTLKIDKADGKVTMPEYVVGQKSVVKSKEPKKAPVATCMKIGLGHLEDVDVADNEDEQKSEEAVVFKKTSKTKSNMRQRFEEEDDESVNAEKGVKRKDIDDEVKPDVVKVGGTRKKAKPRRFVRQQKEDSDESDDDDTLDDSGNNFD